MKNLEAIEWAQERLAELDNEKLDCMREQLSGRITAELANEQIAALQRMSDALQDQIEKLAAR